MDVTSPPVAVPSLVLRLLLTSPRNADEILEFGDFGLDIGGHLLLQEFLLIEFLPLQLDLGIQALHKIVALLVDHD